MPNMTGIEINGVVYEVDSSGGGSVTGVKGNKETTYRTGNVNLTPANIGALPDTTSIPEKTSDLTNDSDFITGLTVLTYGSSTWNDFITAFNANKVVFVRCGAGTTPTASTKPILAHLVKVDYYNGNPRFAEFRFDEYVDQKTYTDQDDHIRIYKLFTDNGWTLTTVPVAPRIVAGDGINYDWTTSGGERSLTLSLDRASITTVSFEVVQTLPQTGETNIIYLVPKSTAQTQNVYDEYIYTNNAWELIGNTEIDLSNYYTKTQVDGIADDLTADMIAGDNGVLSWVQANSGYTLGVDSGLIGIKNYNGGYINYVSVDDTKPTVTEASNRTNLSSGDTLKTIIGKIKKWFTDLKTVAFTGSYNDLTDKPTIPTVNDGKLTIQQNNVDIGDFTANQSTDVTLNLTDTTYGASNGMTLTSGNKFKVGERWSAVSKGLTWSRLFYCNATVGTVGSSGILAISCTRTSVVVNLTLLITASHQGATDSTIIELASSGYSYSSPQIKYRIVVKGDGRYYFEVYDQLSGATASLEQTWNVCYIPLTEASLTKYTAFTDGSTIPSGFTAKEQIAVLGSNASAIRNITRNGTTFTATRQDGSTFTFTQQDTTYSDATQSVHGLMSTSDKTKLDGIASGAEVNIQSDWDQTTTTADDYIKNKPSSLPASDVYAWAKASAKPTYTKSEVGLGNVPNVATNDQTPTFTQASTRANITSGEKLSVIFGKIMKWFADLKTVAFSGSYDDLRDKPTIPDTSNFVQKSGDTMTGQLNIRVLSVDPLHLRSNASQQCAVVFENVNTGTLGGFGFTNDKQPCYFDTGFYSHAIQEKLVSGTSIKTINNESILGSGNINVGGGGLTATVLWTNSSPDSSFAAQTITLSDDITNYTYYEIVYKLASSGSSFNATGLIPTDKSCQISRCHIRNTIRSITIGAGSTANKMTVSGAAQFTNYGSDTSTTNNGSLVPYKVIGFK